jgi:hypothetical protein
MFFANRYCAFPIEKGSRRPYIIHCSDKYLVDNIGAEENKKHFDELAKIIHNKEAQKMFYDELMEIDIDNFNFKEIEKSDLHKILEDSAKPPLVDFVTELIYKHIDDNKFVIHTIELLEKYTEYLRKRNMKFECSQKNFNVELQQVFKVEKFASNGRQKFRFNVNHVKEILLKEYKVDVTKLEDENENEDEEKAESMFVNKDDKTVYVRIEDHNDIIYNQNEKIEMLQESNDDMLGYIKQLEMLVKQLSKKDEDDEPIEKQPKKKIAKMPPINNSKQKVDDNFDFIQLADNTYYNSKTNTTHEKVCDSELLDDDGNFN